uniref:Uncharacterized protein n=1 Tax=Ciona intestinalis TaxID=7719 RepID=H2XRI1_CIOIN
MLAGRPTLMDLPPNITPPIWSSDNWAASGVSYSMKAKPLCFPVIGSNDIFIDLNGPNGENAFRIISSFKS